MQDFRQMGEPKTVEGVVLSSRQETVQQVSPAQKVLRNTYMLLAISMVPAVFGAYIGMNFFPIRLLAASPIMSMIVFFGVFYGMIFAIQKNSTSMVGVALLQVFTAMLGFMTAPLLMVAMSRSNGGELITLAFGGTAAIFFAMAAIAGTVKRPLTGLGNFLAVGAVVLLVGIVASIFVQSSIFSLVLTGGILIFSSLAMLWRINMALQGGMTNYIELTLGLVIDLFNVFTTLLRLLLAFTGNER